jgi:hypothetical protein
MANITRAITVGTSTTHSYSMSPVPSYVNGAGDGVGQMGHFYSRGFNMFRIPVSWQYLINVWDGTSAGSTLNMANLAIYNKYVTSEANTTHAQDCAGVS